ncbi:MAG: DivIVA domain-containing protein [Acidimicrobiia bacterium]
MALTPSDIEKKTFSTALRGYDLDEVDDFLDEMVGSLRDLQEEVAQAKARVAELERGGATAGEHAAPAVVADESAVGRALVAAQETADRMLEDAKKEAEDIVSAARSEADNFTMERDAKKAEIDAEMAEMSQQVAGVRTQLASLATAVADRLDEMDSVIAGKAETSSEPDTVPADDDLVVEEEATVESSEIDLAVDEVGSGEEASPDGEMGDGEMLDETSDEGSEGTSDEGTSDDEATTSA